VCVYGLWFIYGSYTYIISLHILCIICIYDIIVQDRGHNKELLIVLL